MGANRLKTKWNLPTNKQQTSTNTAEVIKTRAGSQRKRSLLKIFYKAWLGLALCYSQKPNEKYRKEEVISQHPEKIVLKIHGWKEHNENTWKQLKEDQKPQEKETWLTIMVLVLLLGEKQREKVETFQTPRGKISWINKNLVKHKKREKTFLGWYKVEEPVKVSSIHSKLNTGA